MQLRLRLLCLIAGLIALTLSISFALIFNSVRRQTERDLDRSLQVAASVWEVILQSQAESLTTSASNLANEAGFLTVLRGTDRATLADYLREVESHHRVADLIWCLDAGGQLLASSDPSRSRQNAVDPLVAAGLEGETRSSFWKGPDGLYLAAVSPILKAGYVDGAILQAWRLTLPVVQRLAQDTSCQIGLLPLGGQPLWSDLASGPSKDSRLRKLSLSDAQGQEVAQLVLARDLTQALDYLTSVAWNLALLALTCLVVALSTSVPWVKKMTESVILLERTQADLEAVYQANLDGLVALDQAGQILKANPAAGLCLGREPEELIGCRLQELLPSQVFSALIALPPEGGRLVQRARWERLGHDFELWRTFLPSHFGQVASLLLTRDSSQKRLRVDYLQHSLELLAQHWTDASRLEGLDMRLGNLLVLSGYLELPPPTQPQDLCQLSQELARERGGECLVEGEVRPHRFSSQAWRLVLGNLIDNAARHGDQPSPRLLWNGQAGGSSLRIFQSEHVPLSMPPAQAGLTVVTRLLEGVAGKLEVTPEGIEVWLPADWQEPSS